MYLETFSLTKSGWCKFMQGNLIDSRPGKIIGGPLNSELLGNSFKVIFMEKKVILTLFMSLRAPN